MKVISVIVPLYYGEKYMTDIISQLEMCKTYLGIRDYIEVIFVNDAPDAQLSLNWKGEFIHITVRKCRNSWSKNQRSSKMPGRICFIFGSG